jgi:Protein of unknown function (DUF429)
MEATAPPADLRCIGVDFSSRPSRRKPIVLAAGSRIGARVVLHGLDRHDSLEGLARALAAPGRWIGGFDLPFGLPRELVESLGWPLQWLPLIRHYATLERAQIRAAFKAFCAARPAGARFAHRACDGPAGSSPSMKWVNPPVAFMLHAGVPLLIDAGVHLPGLHDGDPARIALEAYPGLLARELAGRRSYKSDSAARQDGDRRIVREQIVAALEAGQSRLELSLELTPSQRGALIDEGSADSLDAVLCLMQAAWASGRPNHGLPARIDPIEGWIVSA